MVDFISENGQSPSKSYRANFVKAVMNNYLVWHIEGRSSKRFGNLGRSLVNGNALTASGGFVGFHNKESGQKRRETMTPGGERRCEH